MIKIPQKITIDIDTYQLQRKLRDVEEQREQVEEAVKDTEESAMDSFNQVMTMARTAWVMTSNVVRASGGSIDALFRLVIQTALSGAQVLIPLLLAEEMTPATAIQGAIGLTNIVLMFAAVAEAQKKHSEVITQFRAAQYALMSASNLITYIPSLW